MSWFWISFRSFRVGLGLSFYVLLGPDKQKNRENKESEKRRNREAKQKNREAKKPKKQGQTEKQETEV